MSEDKAVFKEQDEVDVQDNPERVEREAASLRNRVQKALDQKFADYADPKVELQVMHDYLTMGLNMSDLRNLDITEEEKANIFDVKKIKGIANKICTASKKLQDDALEIALSNLKLLVNYLKIELESLNPMNEDIVEALQIMFDEKQTFFQNHTIEEEKEEPEKESQSTQDKSSSSQPKENEPASTESNKEQNLDLLGIDDGNKADDEEMEDQSKFFDITNDKDEQKDDARRAYNPEFHISVSGADDNDHENINALYEKDRERMQVDDIPSSFTPMAGDYVDALKIEPDVPGNISIWEEAQIIQDTGVSYKVEFIRDDYKYTREIDHEFWEESICPRGTHTRDSTWRYELQENVGSFVDYYQVGFGWCEARVTASMTSLDDCIDQVLLQITRIPPGKSKMCSAFKEIEFPQVSIRSPLIRKHKEMFCKNSEEIELEELNKPSSKPSGPSSPWVRKNNKNSVQIKIIEYFCEKGCHLDINNRIKDSENPPRVWLVIQLLNYLTAASKHLSKKNDEIFSPDFEKAIRIYFSGGGINKSIKEFKYDYFETTFNAIRKILHYGDLIKKKIATYIILDAAYQCLITDSLSIRVHGVKEIESTCSKIFKGRITEIKKDDMGEWISNHEIISCIFGSNHHSELFSRSEFILKTLCRSAVGIKQEEINMIWNLTKRDKQTKSEIYTVLQQVGESLGKEFSDFIMERIMEYDHLSNKDLEFMYSFKNKSDFQTELTWKILNNSEDYSEHVVSTAYEKIIDNVKFATMEKKLGIIRNCIDKLKDHKASLIFIKILKAVINCSNISTAKLQNLTDQFEQARQECEEYFFSDFEYYCDRVKECIAEDSSRSYNAGSESFVDKFTHSIHINERLSFIVDFFKFFKSKISKEQVGVLWKIMAIESPCKANYELFFKWMNEQVSNIDSKQYSVLTNELLEFFYKEYLMSKQNSYIHLETEGFRLIKTLFMIINEKEHKMQILVQSQVKKDHGTISSASGATLSSSSYSSDQNAKEFIIYCHPQDLNGVDTFWRIIMECADIGVIAECIMLIINLHQNISNLIEQKRMLIEEDLVKNCISKINELREICRNCSSDDPTIDKNMAKLYYFKKEFTIKQIERICLLIRTFMENSELHGIGDILTQSTIIYDSKLTVLVKNKISYGQGCYNKKKNPKIFKFNVNGNFTLWKLKELVANKLEIDPILIKAEKAGTVSKNFKDSENHKKLCEIGVGHNDILNISSKMSSSMIIKLNLIFSDQTLTPEAENLFNEVFYKFANEDGFMTRKICAVFLQSCTSQMTDENDQRIKRLFDNYDRDNDNLITVEDFKDFYRDSIIKKESTVWANIRSWDYRSDLQKGSERDKRAAKTLLRYLLPRKRVFYDYFLQMLEDEYMIAKCSWELITRLALDPNLLYKLYDFRDFNETGEEIEFKFENLVDINSPFQLYYLLTLIHYFLKARSEGVCSIDVIFNEDEIPQDKNKSDGNQLEVKGKSVGTSVQTNQGLPPPSPAVPVGYYGPLTQEEAARRFGSGLSTSQSATSKADNVVSASVGGDIPIPPPMPVGGDTLKFNSSQTNEEPINKEDDKPSCQSKDDYEVKVYPPGGVEVDAESKSDDDKRSRNQREAEKDSDPELYFNYNETLKTIDGYYEFNEAKSKEWYSNFFKHGGFQFLLDLILTDKSFIGAKLSHMETMTFEEKNCVSMIVTMITLIVTGANVANDTLFQASDINVKEKSTSKELQKVPEDQEMKDNELDEYEIDEAKLLENVKHQNPIRERTVSAIAREENEKMQEETKRQIHASFENDCSHLVQALRGDLGFKILKETPYENFINKVMTLLCSMITKRELSDTDKQIIDNATYIMNILFLFSEDLLETVYKYKDEVTGMKFNDIIIKGITFTFDVKVKMIFSNIINNMCRRIKNTHRVRLPLIVIIEIMKEHFYESFKDDARGYGYGEFYEIFSSLIHEYCKLEGTRNKKFEKIINYKEFIIEIVANLKKYKTKEKRNTLLEDHCLIGIFTILESLFRVKPEYIEEFALEYELLNELFFNCLFQKPIEAPFIDVTSAFDPNNTDLHTNKCKTKECRAKAFSVLNLLCSHSSKIRDVVYNDCLLKMVSRITRPENFAYVPESESRSLYSYCGLKNLGATCYMNSMIQQLYMIPSFKYLLLSVNDQKDEELNTVDDEKSVYFGKMIDDNLLHQFQNAMGFLELSERPHYNAIGLCFSMKDYDGRPTNCSLQQDSHEFVNIAFERLENMLKSTPQKNIITDIFSAKQCTHMTCSHCNYTKQRIEDYYILSVPVKKMNNLEESFNAYTDGEIISDFKCDNCNQKVDITKRCSFVDMPNILMVHLQKIVFNFDTLMNEKIADRFEFPTYINMENYTISKISEKYNIKCDEGSDIHSSHGQNFEYRLVGVIIHQGVAEAGHYYSLICTDTKLKEMIGENWGSTENLTWTEFNDTSIRGFDFRRNFEDECFGKSSSHVYGSSSIGIDSGWNDQWVTSSGASSKSAYVLIYEKRVYNDIKLNIDLNLVSQFGKTKDQIDEEFKEERRSYLRSVYSQYDSKYSTPACQKDKNENSDQLSATDLQTVLSSLECGDIAIPRDLFPFLIVPRNVFIFMTQEQREKIKYVPVVYNKDDNLCYINVKFKEIEKYIPYKIFKKVWEDNNNFLSERQINNPDFFNFFRNTLKQENIVEQQNNQEKLSLLYNLSYKMIFDLLVYAYNNDSIQEVSEVLKKVLLLSDEAIINFSDKMLEDNSNEFIRILMKCSDDAVRDCTSKILSTAVNRMFGRIDLIEKAEAFMMNMINVIHTQAATNWTKFEHFFNLIKTVAIGGEPQLEFMKKHQIETLLSDFFLAERSPIRPSEEKRMSMGNSCTRPMFDSLMQTICYLSRHTDTRVNLEDEIPTTSISDRIFQPGEKEKTVICCKQFALKAIKETFEADNVGRLIAHWSYKNRENSEIFARVFLKGINETEYEEVAPFLKSLHHFLSIKDEFQSLRFEWLLGIPMMVDGSMVKASPPDKPKLGIYAIQSMSDEIFYYPSTLEHLDSVNESILNLIWRCKKRFENYTLFCIHELFCLGDDVLKYLCNMPSPTYQYARYSDWIEQFCDDLTNSKSGSSTHYIETIHAVKLQLEAFKTKISYFEEELKERHINLYSISGDELEYEDIISEEHTPETTRESSENIKRKIEKDSDCPIVEKYRAFPRPYVIGKVISDDELLIQGNEDIRIVISTVECEWTWNKPPGSLISNKTYLEYFKDRKSNISIWHKPAPTKQTVFSRENVNENYIDIGDNSMFNLKEGKTNEQSNLNPIGEEENSDDDKDDFYYYPENIQLQSNSDSNNINMVRYEREDVEPTLVKKENYPANDQDDKENQYVDVPMEDNAEKIESEPISQLFKKNFVALRISVYNFYNKRVSLEVTINSEDGSPNFYVPQSPLLSEIPSNKAKTIAYLHKIHPNKPFGNFSFTYKTDIEAAQIKEEVQQQPKVSDEQGVQGNTGGTSSVPTVTWDLPNDAFEGLQDEINCDQCTLFNPISNHKCEACGATLPHRK